MKRFNLYCAGRIEKSRLRFGLIDNSIMDERAWSPYTEIRLVVVGGIEVGYCGPFTYCCDHGCAHAGQRQEPNTAGSCTHGSAAAGCSIGETHPGIANAIFRRALHGIHLADFVFVWIEDYEAYGTFFEIAYAHALGKVIYLAHHPDIRPDGELWFCFQAATHVKMANNPQDALERAVKRANRKLFRSAP